MIRLGRRRGAAAVVGGLVVVFVVAFVVAGVALEAVPGRGAPPAAPLFEGGARPLRIGPVPAGLANTDAVTCAPCHSDIAAEWRGSMHRASWTDPVFQAAYAHESLAFCRNCHAPLHVGEVPTGVAAADGIGCAVCHVREGTILGAGRGAARGAVAPHPVRVDARVGASTFCAACHDFGFMSAGGPAGRVETRELQQSTFSEWRVRRARGETNADCGDCHMPWRRNTVEGDGGRHRSHAFAARRDPALLASAVKVRVAARPAGERVQVTAEVVPGVGGHGFPTGDLFRRLELTVWPAEAPEQTARIAYERRFGVRAGAAGTGSERSEIADTRVSESAETVRTVELVMPAGGAAGGAARVGWRLEYLLMPRALATRHRIDATVNVTVLAEGVVVVAP